MMRQSLRDRQRLYLHHFMTQNRQIHMKKTFLVSAILLSSANVAHAGFLDFLFGNKEKTEPVAEAPVKAEQASVAEPSMVETGTQIALSLLPTLTKELNVTDQQAEGGMGSILQMAQSTLSTNEFSQLGQGIPGMETLLAAAPLLDSKSAGGNALSSVLANAGGIASNLGGIAKLNEQFEALGLSTDMIIQFASIAIEYFSTPSADTPEGAANTGALLQKGLTAILGQS